MRQACFSSLISHISTGAIHQQSFLRCGFGATINAEKTGISMGCTAKQKHSQDEQLIVSNGHLNVRNLNIY